MYLTATTTTTLPQPARKNLSGPISVTAAGAVQPRCPTCGEAPAKARTASSRENDARRDAQRRIKELETQVKMLTGKATAAADRLADYEDEIRLLKSSGAGNTSFTTTDSRPATSNGRPGTPSSPVHSVSSQTRLPSFLTRRRSNSSLPRAGTPPANASPSSKTTMSTSDLQAALSREQMLRQQAEGKLDQASGELEELSTQLFQQANEMVATERKARAKLEERVAILERRDQEKRKRLESLEAAMKRIERVRLLLGER